MAKTKNGDNKYNNIMAPSGGEEIPNEEEELPEDGFSLASVGEAPMTRALSRHDPKSARTMTAEQSAKGVPHGGQWWKDSLPTFVERVEEEEDSTKDDGLRTSTVIVADKRYRDLGTKIKKKKATETDITTFFSHLKITGKEGKVHRNFRGDRKVKAWKKFKDKVDVKAKFTREEGQGPGEERKGIEFIDYRLYPMRAYTDMPAYLIKGLEIAKMDYYLIVGRPTMAPGSGLAGYKEVTTKMERLRAPCIGVFDHPGMLEDFEDDGYSWIEMPVGDTFMLDVSEMKTNDDYKSVLTKCGKKDYKSKFKKFEKEPNAEYELVDWVGTEENIDMIWPLYQATGEKNGFTVLTKEDFYKYHRIVPNQKVAYIWDVSNAEKKKLVSFNTSFVWKDILHPMWCGTDYDNPLNRTCSTYFILLYNYAHYAIEQPNLNWVDLGATQRKAKTSIGYKPHPCSIYFRCLNSFTHMVVEHSMEKYYHPEKCMTDP